MNIDFIKRLTNIVEANLANENFGVEDLVVKSGTSYHDLHQKLKITSNQTISQFIREIRLKKAKELLLNDELTVAEIAYQVGFGSPTYFNKCFHEYYGYPPGETISHKFLSESIENKVAADLSKPKHKIILKRLIISSIITISIFFLFANILFDWKAVNAKEKTIAILPFKYLSDETEKQYLATGFTDAILYRLKKIKDLRVISNISMEQNLKTNKTAKAIGKEHDVAYLLQGSILKDGDKARLTVELIRTNDESYVWVQKYDRKWEDIFSVQTEVAESIVGELHAIITPEEEELIRKIPTTDLTADDYYQRGKEELTNFEVAKLKHKTSLQKAQCLFLKALEHDSTFALAYTGLAWVHWNRNILKSNFQTSSVDSVLILADRALSYDNQIPEAYTIKGCYYYENGNIEQASREFDKAIKFEPNNWRAYVYKGHISHWIYDDYVAAIGYYTKASIRNRGKELPGILIELGRAYLDIGFIEKSRNKFQEAYSLNSDSATYFIWLAFTEAYMEKFENALEIAKKAYAIDSNYVVDLALYSSFSGNENELSDYNAKYIDFIEKSEYVPIETSYRIGYAYWKINKFKAAYYFNEQMKYDLECIKLGRNFAYGKFAYYNLAAIYAFLGDKVNAYKNLEELNKKQSFGLWWILYLKHDPLFASIRTENKFQRIIRTMESKYRTERERVRKWLNDQKSFN